MLKRFLEWIVQRFTLRSDRNQLADLLDPRSQELVRQIVRDVIESNTHLLRNERTREHLVQLLLVELERSRPMQMLGRRERFLLMRYIEDRLRNASLFHALPEKIESELYQRVLRAIGLS